VTAAFVPAYYAITQTQILFNNGIIIILKLSVLDLVHRRLRRGYHIRQGDLETEAKEQIQIYALVKEQANISCCFIPYADSVLELNCLLNSTVFGHLLYIHTFTMAR
jgi:hypothetical protein